MRWLMFLLSLMMLSGFSLVAASPAPAEAAKCKKGYVWVAKKVTQSSSGKQTKLWYRERASTEGYCKKIATPSVGEEKSTNPITFCLIEGITRQERQGSYLLISGKRWLACPKGGGGGVTKKIDPSTLARALAVQLRLPDATPVFGPDPNGNEWKMLTVGFPVWLWTQGPRHKETIASAQGLTFRLSADLQSTRFSMGDGRTVTCTQMTSYTASVKPGSPSPTCGYVYATPSLPKGRYTVTATATWRINWSVDGFSGTFPMSYLDSAQLAIGELVALNR